MARKLGEILVAGQFLGAGELKRALDAQLIFGGRLGTNLLELGFLDETTLSKALKEQKRVEVASSEMLSKATQEALRLVPSKVADKHKLIPLALEDKKLKVAMVDPTDLVVLDELAFMTGCQIVPYIAPEVRLLAWLERYYKIPRPLRYIKLSQSDPAQAPKRAPQAAGAQAPPADRQKAQEARPNAPSAQSARGSGAELSVSDLLGVGPGEALTPEALKKAGDAPAEQRQQLDAAVEQLRQQRAAENAAAETPRYTKDEAAMRLADADTREEIGEALVGFAATQFRRVLAFVLQRDRALGWMARLPGRSSQELRSHVRQLVVPLDQPSVLQTLVQQGQYYMGELPARPGDELIAKAVGEPRPVNLVVLPVLLQGRIFIALYGDNGSEPLTGFDMRGLRSTCEKAALAMDVLLLRSRIRQG